MKKTYVLNKPALLTSEDSLSRFGNNDIVIPMAVLEDLKDSLKKEKSARRAIGKKLLRYLSEDFDSKELMTKGVTLENGTHLRVSINYTDQDVDVSNISAKDKRILQTCKGLQKEGKNVVLICNDETLRMKARNIDIIAEELKDRVFPTIRDQYKGYANVFTSSSAINKLHTYGWLDVTDIYEYDKIEWLTNLYLVIEGESSSTSALAYFDGEKVVPIHNGRYPYDIKPKNVKQRFVLHALMDENTPLVIIKGDAGTGKTYCSVASGLYQTMEKRIYNQMLITRPIENGNGEEYGYLPGEIENKFDPYIYGVYDNLERIYNPSGRKYDDDKAEVDFDSYSKKRAKIRADLFETGIIEIQPLGYLRGRSIAKRWFIIDEMQNVDPEFAKSIVSRAGEGSKFIFLGDPTQIDSPELSENYNGLVYLSEMMKGQSLCRQITLGGGKDTVRSPLAQLAVDILV